MAKEFKWKDNRLEYKGWKAVVLEDGCFEVINPEGERVHIGSASSKKDARRDVEDFLFLRAKQ